MRYSFILFFLSISMMGLAQRETSVHGKSVYVVSDNDHLTLREAKNKCIEKAKAEAVKAEFGEQVMTDVIDSNVESEGAAAGSYFWENTAATAKGEWLGDTKAPKIDVEYVNGDLVFSAEVWGVAREIVQSKTDLDLDIMKDISGKKGNATSFEKGERIYLHFRAPADGYLAVYLTVGNGKTSCLLPYPKDSDGRFPIKNGVDYHLFDKEEDPIAQYYRMSTKHRQEVNQLVVIYSPNAFTKFNAKEGNAKLIESVDTSDFEKWLLKCQRSDRDMVVVRKWLRIHNSSLKE